MSRLKPTLNRNNCKTICHTVFWPIKGKKKRGRENCTLYYSNLQVLDIKLSCLNMWFHQLARCIIIAALLNCCQLYDKRNRVKEKRTGHLVKWNRWLYHSRVDQKWKGRPDNGREDHKMPAPTRKWEGATHFHYGLVWTRYHQRQFNPAFLHAIKLFAWKMSSPSPEV